MKFAAKSPSGEMVMGLIHRLNVNLKPRFLVKRHINIPPDEILGE